MSRKVSLTSTLRPRTVWLPLIEASHPYGVNWKVQDGGGTSTRTGGGAAIGASAPSAGLAAQRSPKATAAASRPLRSAWGLRPVRSRPTIVNLPGVGEAASTATGEACGT